MEPPIPLGNNHNPLALGSVSPTGPLVPPENKSQDLPINLRSLA